jgi:hypothetical protein
MTPRLAELPAAAPPTVGVGEDSAVPRPGIQEGSLAAARSTVSPDSSGSPRPCENLWLRVRPVLEAIAARVTAADEDLTHSLGYSANPSFPFRAYLAFGKGADGREVAITVDIKKRCR